jgi:hypothetical protein
MISFVFSSWIINEFYNICDYFALFYTLNFGRVEWN